MYSFTYKEFQFIQTDNNNEYCFTREYSDQDFVLTTDFNDSIENLDKNSYSVRNIETILPHFCLLVLKGTELKWTRFRYILPYEKVIIKKSEYIYEMN